MTADGRPPLADGSTLSIVENVVRRPVAVVIVVDGKFVALKGV
jgi:hypothetical protein